MRGQTRHERLEQAVLAHVDAAYNLARWLTGNDQDAEDMVQESCLRATRFIGSLRGADGRGWLLRIVRNTCCTWLQQRAQTVTTPLTEAHDVARYDLDPATLLLQQADGELVRQALAALPAEFREVLVLRELEGLSYKEIADIAEIPPGTVMSRLARARQRLKHELAARLGKEA